VSPSQSWSWPEIGAMKKKTCPGGQSLGEDKKFVKALAKIDGRTASSSVPTACQNPSQSDSAGNQLAEPNLANGAGLPASPFRTDKWSDAVNNAP